MTVIGENIILPENLIRYQLQISRFDQESNTVYIKLDDFFNKMPGIWISVSKYSKALFNIKYRVLNSDWQLSNEAEKRLDDIIKDIASDIFNDKDFKSIGR